MNPRPAAQHVEDYREIQRLKKANSELIAAIRSSYDALERSGLIGTLSVLLVAVDKATKQ